MMKKTLRFDRNCGYSIYVVFSENDVIIGELIKDVDGFFYWYSNGPGCLASCTLIEIADKLEEINKPWEKFINDNLPKMEKVFLLDF